MSDQSLDPKDTEGSLLPDNYSHGTAQSDPVASDIDADAATLFPATTGAYGQAVPDAATDALSYADKPIQAHASKLSRAHPDATEPRPADHPDATDPQPVPGPDATAQGSGQRPAAPEGALTVTILEAARILREEKGFDEIKPRAIQRYCSGERRAGQLRCYWNYQSDQYLVDRQSLDELAERLSNEAPKGTQTDITSATDVDADNTKAATGPLQDARNIDLDIYDHPYVQRLEHRIDKQEERYTKLQAEYREDMNSAQQRLIQLQQATVIGNSETLADFMLKSGQGLSGEPAADTITKLDDEDVQPSQDRPAN
jgi:hypothetical protein